MHRTLSNICKVQKRYSALFVNGAKATEQFVYVTPYIHISELLKQKEITQQQLNKRKCNINIQKIENLWSIYEELKDKKIAYEKKKSDLSKELSKLLKIETEESEASKKLRIQINLLKDNIKKLKTPLWSAEEAAFLEALKLPNQLHSETPEQNYKILYSHLTPPKGNKNHMTLGKELELIKYKNDENYYLTGEAAIFELGSKFYISSVLKLNNFIQISNTDFVKSLVVEGCGENHTNPDLTFILHHNEDTKVNIDNRLHLTGGASLYSFFAYHTKNVVYPKVFPLKYFTMGRQYTPSSHGNSLFNVSQSSVIEIFNVLKTSNEMDNTFEEIVNIIRNIFVDLNYHFRLALVPAHKLKMFESLRLEIQMYSSSLKKYIDVGSVSLSGDFISKRLMFTYVENKEHKFPFVLSGTILNVPKFLACVLEQNNDFCLPDQFAVNKWMLK